MSQVILPCAIITVTTASGLAASISWMVNIHGWRKWPTWSVCTILLIILMVSKTAKSAQYIHDAYLGATSWKNQANHSSLVNSTDQRVVVGLIGVDFGLGVIWVAFLHEKKCQRIARERRRNSRNIAMGTRDIDLCLKSSWRTYSRVISNRDVSQNCWVPEHKPDDIEIRIFYAIRSDSPSRMGRPPRTIERSRLRPIPGSKQTWDGHPCHLWLEIAVLGFCNGLLVPLYHIMLLERDQIYTYRRSWIIHWDLRSVVCHDIFCLTSATYALDLFGVGIYRLMSSVWSFFRVVSRTWNFLKNMWYHEHVAKTGSHRQKSPVWDEYIK